MNWKICENCHHKVSITAKNCPYCNHDSFEMIPQADEYGDIKTEIEELFEYCDLIDNRGEYDKT